MFWNQDNCWQSKTISKIHKKVSVHLSEKRAAKKNSLILFSMLRFAVGSWRISIGIDKNDGP
jgi:hypothetical protein